MKLLNYTSAYFAGLLLLIISIWAVIFYYGMLDKIYLEVNEGLENQKQLIIRKAQTDPSVLNQPVFSEGNYVIYPADKTLADNFHDVYLDTSIYMQSEREHEPVRTLETVFSLNGNYYRLIVAASTVEEGDIIRQMFYSLLLLYFGLVASILILNNILLKQVWRPFYNLLNNLENFSLDKPENLPVLKTNISEFRLLNNSVHKMIALNANIYNSQKQFIENAAHELQTPIAISLNKLEALAESHTITGEEMNLLASAVGNLERLTRLNKSLLLLTKISNRQFDEVSAINLNAIVQKAVLDFDDQLQFSKVTITIRQQENCVLKMNAGLAAILVNNLVKNAIVHNIPGGTVSIDITGKYLRIENDGKSQPLNEEKMFARFYKESQSATSTGLGLAIVKAIAGLYDFTAAYTYNGRHVITISFQL